MALKEISENEFYKYDIGKNPLGVARESCWFRDKGLNLLATVVRDNFDKDWGYVILGLDEDQVFRFSDLELSLETEDIAISNLFSKVKSISKVGRIESDIYKSTLFDANSKIIITDIDSDVKKYFKKYPEKLYEIHPRKFEELIAGIMKDMGFEIELTQATRDGGRDIIASIKNSITDILCYIQCKRYAAKNKIGVGIIREVQGVHYCRKPAKSIIITTSFFTSDAREETRQIENQLDLKDYGDIKIWLEKY